MTECHVHEGSLLDFTDDAPKQGSPSTPGLVSSAAFEQLRQEGKVLPTARLRRFTRDFFNDKITMPDGREIEFWGFEDENGTKSLPSPTIRVNQGDIVQTTLKASKGAHTIHHHGIEPDDFNDGVGHTSFEVSGSYTYQFIASHAGTYFYHCHVNTVLHVQMGMFGMLIVDPPGGQNPDGSGSILEDAGHYDVEAIVCGFELDPRWHELNHAAGLDGEDVGLHNFNPRYFLVNGVAAQPGADVTQRQILDELTIRAKVGQRVAFRFLNGGYFPTFLAFGNDTDVLAGEVVAHDARPFSRFNPRTGRKVGNVTKPFPLVGDLITVAEREDIMLTTQKAGTYFATIFFRHWIRGTNEGRIDIPIVFE